MKNPRENAHIKCLSRQMNGGIKNTAFDKCYQDIQNKDYGYIMLDFSMTQNDKCRIRDSIFPEDCTVYYKID